MKTSKIIIYLDLDWVIYISALFKVCLSKQQRFYLKNTKNMWVPSSGRTGGKQQAVRRRAKTGQGNRRPE